MIDGQLRVFSFGALAGSLPISALSDSVGGSRTIFMSELFIAPSVGLLLLAARSNLWMIFVSIGIYGIFFWRCLPSLWGSSRDYFEMEVTGTVLRWGFALAGIASLVSSALVSRV